METTVLSEEDYQTIYALLAGVTPLKEDCGLSCGAACCTQQGPSPEEMGIYLLPGESCMHDRSDPYLTWSKEDAIANGFPSSWDFPVDFVRCKGPKNCRRERRPIQCMTFPLAPHLNEDGELVLIYNDTDLPYRCPLIDEETILESDFYDAVYEAWEILLSEPSIYDLVQMESDIRRRAAYELMERLI